MGDGRRSPPLEVAEPPPRATPNVLVAMHLEEPLDPTRTVVWTVAFQAAWDALTDTVRAASLGGRHVLFNSPERKAHAQPRPGERLIVLAPGIDGGEPVARSLRRAYPFVGPSVPVRGSVRRWPNFSAFVRK